MGVDAWPWEGRAKRRSRHALKLQLGHRAAVAPRSVSCDPALFPHSHLVHIQAYDPVGGGNTWGDGDLLQNIPLQNMYN